MTHVQLRTTQLELRPLASGAAAALPEDRAAASARIGASLSPTWPLAELLDALPMQAAAAPGAEPFGIWVMIESATGIVVGDIGFLGPADVAGAVEVGYGVVPDRRRRGYAGEALAALVAWVLEEPGVVSVVARCEVGNVASMRTLCRVGFVETGTADGTLAWRFAGAPSPS